MIRKVSIIFPVFNVSEFIKDSLLSALNQDYPFIELIIVDDCSSDDSMDILNNLILTTEFKFSYKIIKHEINKGLSAARNTGIRNATGDYIYFLDSDDMISKDCISLLINCLNKYSDVEYIIGNTKTIRSENDTKYSLRLKDEVVIGNNRISKLFYQGKWIVTAWNKLINRDFILKNNLFFHEGILHEDELWSFQMTQSATKIAFCYDFTYFYLIRNSSITNRSISISNINGFYTVLIEEIKFLKKSKNVYLAACIITLAVRLINLINDNNFEINYSNSVLKKIKDQISYNLVFQSMSTGVKGFTKAFTFLLPIKVALMYLNLFYYLNRKL